MKKIDNLIKLLMNRPGDGPIFKYAPKWRNSKFRDMSLEEITEYANESEKNLNEVKSMMRDNWEYSRKTMPSLIKTIIERRLKVAQDAGYDPFDPNFTDQDYRDYVDRIRSEMTTKEAIIGAIQVLIVHGLFWALIALYIHGCEA